MGRGFFFGLRVDSVVRFFVIIGVLGNLVSENVDFGLGFR